MLQFRGEGPTDETGATSITPGLMHVVANGLTLEAPSTIPAGWTTLRFDNASEMTHFAVVERLPEGQSVASQQAEIAPVFQAGLALLATGDVDAALARFGDLPAWFGDVVFMGGPGLTAPGHVSEATINLAPGTYIFECYVKTNGVFHSYNPDSTTFGMVREFSVTDDTSGAPEPVATVHLSLSSTGGVRSRASPSQARRPSLCTSTTRPPTPTSSVMMSMWSASQIVDPNILENWMDWRSPTGLQTPAPAEFLGGLNEMPAGSHPATSRSHSIQDSTHSCQRSRTQARPDC